MDWYEKYKKDLEETYIEVNKMWKSCYRSDVLLLAMIVVAVTSFIIVSVMYFCRGNWYIAIGVCHVSLAIIDGWIGVRTVRRMRDTKERIKANDVWYENELNRLNNLIKENENESENS